MFKYTIRTDLAKAHSLRPGFMQEQITRDEALAFLGARRAAHSRMMGWFRVYEIPGGLLLQITRSGRS